MRDTPTVFNIDINIHYLKGAICKLFVKHVIIVRVPTFYFKQNSPTFIVLFLFFKNVCRLIVPEYWAVKITLNEKGLLIAVKKDSNLSHFSRVILRWNFSIFRVFWKHFPFSVIPVWVKTMIIVKKFEIYTPDLPCRQEIF